MNNGKGNFTFFLIILLLNIVGLTGQLAHSQVREAWVATYDFEDWSDAIFAMALGNEGSVYVAGLSSNDFATIKYDGQTGQVLWIARYNGPGNGSDSAKSLAVDAQDDIIVTGASLGINTNLDYATLKYADGSGSLLWVMRVGSDGNSEDRAQSIGVSVEGDVYVTGIIERNLSSPRGLTLKHNGQAGSIMWSTISVDAFDSLAVDEESHVYVCGTRRDGIANFRTIKYEGTSGRPLWAQSYHDTLATAIRVGKSGNVYVSGYTHPWFPLDFLTVKYEQSPPGDVDYDFCVDDVDLIRVLLEFGESGDLPEDVNWDGVVDDKDLLTVLFNFGRGCGVE